MNLFYRILFSYIFTQVCIWETYGANSCSGPPPTIDGTSIITIKEGQTVLYMCDSGNEFSSGDSVIVSDCTSTGWYTITATCDSSTKAENCSADATVEEPQHTIRIHNESFKNGYFRVYQCMESKEWLSGRPIRVMPCRNKEWIKIYDICDESCQIPRDCADVAELNLGDDGEYLVIPSGESNGEIKTVHCFLEKTEANHGGSWTLIFRNDKSNEMKFSKAEFISGFGDPTDALQNYYIGLNFLANISQNFSDRSIGNVMEILFYESSDASMPKYYVTYGNLTVGNEWTGHELFSVGTHHGNAGDAFCEQVGTKFKYDGQEGPYWWGVDSSNWESIEEREGNFLSHGSKWPPLDNEGIEIDHVIIRIRPYDFDRELFCPPMVGSHPSWKSTNVSIPFNRTVGTEITWWCNGSLLYEGREGGDRTKEGKAICEEGPPPDWSRNVTLPCTTECPKGFGLLDDGLRCFLFSNTSASSFIDATLKCAAMNSTLAVVNTTTDLDKATDEEFYFVNHALRGTEQKEVEFNITSTGLNCTDENTKVCKANEDNECAVITSEPSYEFQDCNSSLPYVCEIGTPDPVCPFGYKKYNYICFSVVKEMTTFKEAYEACAKNGSSLAYPTTLAVSSTINLHILEDFGLTSNENNEFFVGLNYNDGTWNKQEFRVEKDLEDKLDSSNSLIFRIFKPSSEIEGGTYVPVDISYQSTSAKTHALCQYPGPIECSGVPPVEMDNMQVKWTNQTVVGTEISYWCDEGYAVNRNASYTVQNITCYSILSEWYPSLLPCEETPVCTDWPILGSNNTISTITNESSYIGGNISYTCPPGLIFNDLRTEINLTCSKYDGEFSFNETEIPACDLCSGSFEHANSTSDYQSTEKYNTGDSVNLECARGFQFLSGISSYEVKCSEEGWNTTAIERCVPMCTGEVNYGNASSTWDSKAYYKIGSENELTCDEGYQYAAGERTQKINCSESGWNTTGLEHCVEMCTGGLFYGHANSTWDEESYYTIGSQHEIQCNRGYQYLSGEMKRNVTCTSEGWNTTGVEECYEMCNGSVSYGGATSTWDPTNYYPIGSQRELQCNDSYQYLSGGTRQNITCSISGWNTTGLEECVKKCEGSLSYGNASSTWDETLTYPIGDTGELKCIDGYQYSSGKVKQNVTCAVGGWNVTDLEECYQKCTGGKFFGNANSTWDPLKYYSFGETQELECIEGYQYLTGKMNQNITCSVEGWNTTGLKECVPMCKGELSYGNASLSSDASVYYKIGEIEDLICNETYQYLSGMVNQSVTCTSEGWNTTGLEKCVKKCTGSVSYGNANSTWTPSDYYEIGFVGQLKCSEDYEYSGGKKTQNITCTEKGWKTEGLAKCGENLECRGGVTYGNANSTWEDSKTFEIGSVGELECFEGHQYLSGARKQNITCSEEGWNKANLESCVKMCTGPLEHGNANSKWNANVFYPIGDIQTIECNEGYQYLWNGTKQNVTCTKGGWGTSNLENCVEMCNSNVTLKANNEPLPSTKKYYKIGEQAKVECKSGFEYAFEKTTQTIKCTEEGWDLSSLKKCSKTCNGDPPEPGNHVTPLNVTSRGIGDTISYKCESGHFEPLKEGESPPKEIFVTCNENGVWESPLGDKPLDCVVLCMDDPPAAPANSTREWDGKSRTKDTSITYECDSGLHFGNLSSTWTLVCDGTDWLPYDKNSFTCSKVCQEDPPKAVGGIVPVNVTSRAVGTGLTYECEKGLHFEPMEENSDPPTKITVNCSEDGTWTSPLGNMAHKCVKLCVEDPPKTPKNGTLDWNGKTRLKNTSITYECDGNLLFGNYSSTWVVTCDGTKWLPYDEDLFYCSKTCNMEDLPKPGERQTNSVSGSYATVGESVLYKCDNFTANKDGSKSYEITCQDTGTWDTSPKNFLCEDACDGPPEPNPEGVTYNFTGDFREGVIVEYVCTENEFQQYYTKKIYNQCSNKKWTKTVIPSCGEESPFVPVEPLGKYEKHYRETADFWCSEISSCFSESTGGDEADQKIVCGPKGFGKAMGLEGQCRIREGDFEDPTTNCILNPSNCDGGGLSYSIWVKHSNYENYLESIDSEEKFGRMYIMSSGGDKKGHPGFAMYHENNHFLVAVVSTGDQYWTVEAVAQLSAGYWTNVGAIWNKEDGLKLFVNNTKVGDSSVIHTSQKKAPLEPAQVMLGCHKTSTNKTYRGFNKRASMDEFSLWRHELVGEEKDKIMGGFRAEYADKSAEELREIVENVDTSNSDQADSSANIANLLLDDVPDDSDEGNGEVASTADTPIEEADSETFKKNVEMAMRFLKIDLLPQSIPENKAASQMYGMPFAAGLLNKRNKKNWLTLQKEQDILGASQTIEAMVQHQMEVLRRTKLENDTTVFCRENGKDGVYNKACKMTMRAFLGMTDDGMIRKPNIYPEAYQKAWNMPYDIAGVFDSIFRNEDCLDRHVSIANTVIDGVDKFVHLGVNRARLDHTKKYRIGSRHISLIVSVDPASPVEGSASKKKINCNPSREVLQDYPVMYKTEHLEKALAHRVLLFHEEEVDSDIAVRRCALWNANQSDFGVWDPAGCKVVETSAEFTKCACDRMGTFVVLTEEVEPKVVKEEPKWLVILKYVLYGLSAVLILIYIVVVAVAKDLRDQLHLMGVNVGIAFIAGSAVIICTDFESITNDRHMCVVLGTLLQFFYGALGFWGVALGHASFRAITRGVIGGNLIPACMMCWGVSLLLTGIPFIEFLQDLGTDPRCFISWENVPKYPFFIPQIVCSIFSMFYAIVILTNLSTPALRKETLVDDYGSFARGTALLDIVISLTWVFGFLTFLRFDFDTDFNPIFQVLNSSTGVCLFLFIGVGSNRWRLFVLGKSKIRRKIVRKYAFGLPALNEGEDTNYLTEDNNRQ